MKCISDFEAKKEAKKKLDEIIVREGDMNGERLKPEYLQCLIAEKIAQMRFSQLTISGYKEKRNVAKASVPM
jgi:hypothetical protein